MKKLLIALFLSVFTLSLTGCATGPGEPGLTRQQGGTILGGVAGGVLGSQIGGGSGRIAGAIGGTLLGGFLGSEIGRSMDEAAQARVEEATVYVYEHGGRRDFNYRNVHGYSETYATYREPGGRMCRRYRSIIYINGVRHRAYGVACRHRHGGWVIVR